MFDSESLNEITDSIRRNRLRNILTGFGIFWGALMLTILLGASGSLRSVITHDFENLPVSVRFWVQGPTQTPFDGFPAGRRVHLSFEDASYVSAMPQVKKSFPQNCSGVWDGLPVPVKFNGGSATFPLEGGFPDVTAMFQVRILTGRDVDVLDLQMKRRVAILGEPVKQIMFGDQDSIGKIININNVPFTVIGVFESSSLHPDRSDQEKIIIPNSTFSALFGVENKVCSLVVLPEPGVDPNLMERDLLSLLLKIKHISQNDVGVIGSYNASRDSKKSYTFSCSIGLLSWIVAASTILMGASGISYVLVLAIKERTAEFGLRKALGATNASLIYLIVFEALLVTFISGGLGLILGVIGLECLTKISTQNIGTSVTFANSQIDFQSALIILSLSLCAGLAAAIIPSLRTISIAPATALKDE